MTNISMCVKFIKETLLLSGTVIDDIFFKLHYRLTLLVMVVLGLLVAYRQHYDTVISCRSNKAFFTEEYMNNYCYTETTFSIVEAFNKTIANEIVYPGVDKSSHKKTIKHQTYYQWVSIALFLQAFSFYLPKLLWKFLENGKIKSILDGTRYPESKDLSKSDRLVLLVSRVLAHSNHNGKYFGYYLIGEVLNFVNVIAQMLITDAFLGGGFMSLGSQVARSDTDGMVRVFPRLANCLLRMYGASGDVQSYSTYCLLPINALNEKIYVFLWFWLVTLAGITVLVLALRIGLVFSRQLRFVLLEYCTRNVRRQDLQKVLERRSAGDWFLLYLLSKNINSIDFSDVITSLASGESVKSNYINLVED